MPLHLICERLRNHLNIEGSVPAVVDEACSQLGLDTTGSLLQRAELCYTTVFGYMEPVDGQGSDSSVVAGRPVDSSAQVPVAVGVRVVLPIAGQPLETRPQVSPPEELAADENTRRAQPSQSTEAIPNFERLIRCEARGGSYESFRGDWELSTDTPLYNARPHYTHTLSGMTTVAHLFHCIDPHHAVPGG